MHGKIHGRRCQFYIDRIQKCTVVFKLKIFNLHIQDVRYKILFCIYLSSLSYIYFELLKQRAVIAYFASLDLSIYLLFNKKTKELLIVYRKNLKSLTHDQDFKFKGESKGTFMLCYSYFYVVPLFFIFEICNKFLNTMLGQ